MSVEALYVNIILPHPFLLHHCCSSRTPSLVILTNNSAVMNLFLDVERFQGKKFILYM
jgi:hypothetical protein